MSTAQAWLPVYLPTPARHPVAKAVPAAAASLHQLDVGRTATIAQVGHAGELGERLMEMGLVAGTQVEVLRRGRWSGLVQLGVRGYVLSLRHEDTHNIEVLPTPG